jgi:hypothetical protein
VFSSILVAAVLYVLFHEAAVIGFNDNVAALTNAQIPLITAAATGAHRPHEARSRTASTPTFEGMTRP